MEAAAKTYLSTFKFYNEKGRRLSIFAETVGDALQITVIPCSTKDQFSKAVGRNLFENIETQNCYFEPYNVIIKNKKPKGTFMKWCKDRYRQMVTGTIEVQYLGKLPERVFEEAELK